MSDDVTGRRDELLDAARVRGRALLAGEVLPPALDQFTVYTGLIDKALDLGKLIATEERDLHVIDSAYRLEMAAITAEFAKIENSMRIDAERDDIYRDQQFAIINKLIDAGNFELASEIHKRLIDSKARSAMDQLIELRNKASPDFPARPK